MTVANKVIHQQTSSVGLSSLNGRSGGASEYIDMVCWDHTQATPVILRRGTSGETRRESFFVARMARLVVLDNLCVSHARLFAARS